MNFKSYLSAMKLCSRQAAKPARRAGEIRHAGFFQREALIKELVRKGGSLGGGLPEAFQII